MITKYLAFNLSNSSYLENNEFRYGYTKDANLAMRFDDEQSAVNEMNIVLDNTKDVTIQIIKVYISY